jgi:RNA recognition motif-containing protein
MTATKLFVGNLPYSTTEQDLRELVGRSRAAVVSVRLVSDLDTGRSKGHAFVEVETPEDGARVMRELDGFNLDGRSIVVNEARPRGPIRDRRRP